MQTAKIFWNGHSQAVRLPKEFRFGPDTREVEIRKEGNVLILEPLQEDTWPEDFWTAFGSLSEDFERPVQHRQTRESLDP